MENDAALDLVNRLEDRLGVETNELIDATAVTHPYAAAALTELGLFEAVDVIDIYGEAQLAHQIVADIAVRLGVPLGEFACVARRAAMLDTWAQSSPERLEAMIRLAQRIDTQRTNAAAA